MCRLLGMVANRPTTLTFSLLVADNRLQGQAVCNPHGWGIASCNDGLWNLVRKPESALVSQHFECASLEATGSVFISHIRKASRGSLTEQNTHPFKRGNWVLAHNGTIQNHDTLRSLCDSGIQPEGETDSETFFCLFLTLLQRRCPSYPHATANEAVAALSDAIERVPTTSGLNLLVSDGAHLYFYRRRRDLKILQRSLTGHDSLKSSQLRLMLDAKKKHGERAILIATEKLTEEPWSDVDEEVIFYVDSTLDVHRAN